MKKTLNDENKILSTISEIYIFIMIILYPLIVDNTGFFHILECKWYSYIIITISYLITTSVIILYYSIIKKTFILKEKKLSKIQWIAIVLLIINIISCFASPFFKDYNLFVGIGRGEGLITTSLYIISFLFISLFLKFKKRYILYFSISSILLNIIAVLQYIGFNPFNMYQYGIGTHNTSFMITIGNVDFISALYCILLTISFSAYMFIDDHNKISKCIHLISLFMSYFIFSIINVNSGKVALLAVFLIILPFTLINNKRLSKLLVCLSLIIMTYAINIFINPEYHYTLNKIIFNIQFNKIFILMLITSLILFALSYITKKFEYTIVKKDKFIKCFYLLIIILIIVFLTYIYIHDFGKIKWGFMYELHAMLHGDFSDRYATYRMFLWKRTLRIFPQYPLIGSGPDTFVIRFMRKYTADIAAIGELTLNDTAGNVYLTMLINTGLAGLITYLTFLVAQIKMGIKNMNKYSKVLLLAVICFIIQDFFNLWVVIVTPIFWILLAIHYVSLDKNIEK